MIANSGEDYPKYWNKDVMKEKLNIFKKLEVLAENFHNPKTLKYYIPHMFKVMMIKDLII
jgi:hypothetical protein